MLPFDKTSGSSVTYGAAWYNSSLLPSPKIQILDLRYYIGTYLDEAEITTIKKDTSCHSSCTGGCTGPGSYFCSEYIQLVSPHYGWTGTGGSIVEGSSYVKFSGTDSFMMGRTWSGNSSAFTGWLK